jgi:purine-binding chemotaxis protein CheW
MISAPKQFDWKVVQQRLRDAEAALDRAGVADERQLDQVFRQRLHDYANRKPRLATTADIRRVLVFLLGARRYAVELPAVIKVFPLRQCTPVPAAAKEIVGIINVGGEIRSVVDAAELLGVSASATSGEGQVVLLRHANLEVGLRVDHVEAIETIAADSLVRAESVENSPSLQYVEGVTPESLIVLNMRQLMSHSVFQSEPA